MPKPKKPDEVLKILKEHDPRFEIYAEKGKGSHRMIYHPEKGASSGSYPIPYHKGKDLGKGVLKGLIRRFDLPQDIFG